MWKRDVLLIGLSLAGLGTLTVALYPSQAPRQAVLQADEFDATDLRPVIQRIDATFRQQWSDAGLEPAPRATHLAVARRLDLALMGTVPSLQGIRQIEALPHDRQVPYVLTSILHDRRFADYLAERLARVFVGTESGPFVVYRRRRFVSWLSDELMKNTPYDAIVREMIASTGLWTDKPATNFLTVTLEDGKGINAERLAGRFARAFLGVRIDCAQCHNHPFEKWKQGDFQGLAAYFGQARQGFTGIYDDAEGNLTIENRKTGVLETIPPRVPFANELLPSDGIRRARLAQWVTDPNNRYLARATANRVWGLMLGRPLVEPVDSLSPDDPPAVLQILAEDFAANGYDLRRLIRLIAATAVFQLDSAGAEELTDGHEKAWAAFPITRLRAEQVVGNVLQAGSLETLDADSHIITKTLRLIRENDFVSRYGDNGEEELESRGGTIPQRLLLMNGQVVKEQIQDSPFSAATRVGLLAPDDAKAVEVAYLTVLTRRPTSPETAHFEARLAGTTGHERSERMEDLYWTLMNSSECSWNH
jgi:hypothetical protein